LGRFLPPMDLRHLGAVREGLAVVGNPSLERFDHRRIPHDHRERLSVVTDRNNLPGFVSPELRECEPTRHFQRVLVLRGNGPAAQDDEHHRDNRNRQRASTLHLQSPLTSLASIPFFTAWFLIAAGGHPTEGRGHASRAYWACTFS